MQIVRVHCAKPLCALLDLAPERGVASPPTKPLPSRQTLENMQRTAQQLDVCVRVFADVHTHMEGPVAEVGGGDSFTQSPDPILAAKSFPSPGSSGMRGLRANPLGNRCCLPGDRAGEGVWK